MQPGVELGDHKETDAIHYTYTHMSPVLQIFPVSHQICDTATLDITNTVK